MGEVNEKTGRKPAEMPLEEVAERLGITRQKLYARRAAGIVPHRKVGRHYVVIRADFERWMREGTPPATVPVADPATLLRLLAGEAITLEVTIKVKHPPR